MREVLLNICLTAVAVSLFKMLIPENTFKKQINFLISCFFIVSVIFFISGGNYDISALQETLRQENTYVDFSEEITKERRREISEKMTERVKEVLAEEEIYPKKIYIIVNISGIYSISINEIKLVLSDEDDFQKASELVEREVGKSIKVSIEIGTG